MGQTDILTLKGKFTACQKMLTVFGDEVRQRLLLLMLEGDPNGVRVADISDKMKLTPPAVSHHMQILKDAGVVHCRKEGKYMYFSGLQRKGHRQAAGIVRADERDARAPLSRFPTVKKEQE